MLFDRVFLASLIAGTWALIKLTEELLPDKALYYLPKPLALYSVLVLIVAMAIHTVWFAVAQKRKGFFKTRFENLNENIPVLNSYPSVDIFVALYNEEKVISSTIENLMSLNYPSYKIYLIDDNSTDSTKQIINDYQNKFPDKVKTLCVSKNGKRGKASALNYALNHSSGELIVVFDADAKVYPDFLLKMVPYAEGKNVAGVQSQKRVSNSRNNYLTKLQENEYCLDNYFQCGRDSVSGHVELRGNGQLIKRKALEEVGLWNEKTLTDDLELSTRFIVNGWKVRFCKEAIVYEQAPIKFRSLLIQRLRWCEGSLRRYLSNILKFFGPTKEPTFSQQFDTFVFLSQFAVPIWLFLDIIAEVVRYITEQETHLTSLMLISFAIWFITLINLIFGIRIYRQFSWGTSIIRAFETNLYFLTVWPLIVLLTVRKILFSRTKGKWHRTEHYSDVELRKV